MKTVNWAKLMKSGRGHRGHLNKQHEHDAPVLRQVPVGTGATSNELQLARCRYQQPRSRGQRTGRRVGWSTKAEELLAACRRRGQAGRFPGMPRRTGSRMTAMDNATRNAGDMIDLASITTSADRRRTRRNHLRRRSTPSKKAGKETVMATATTTNNVGRISQGDRRRRRRLVRRPAARDPFGAGTRTSNASCWVPPTARRRRRRRRDGRRRPSRQRRSRTTATRRARRPQDARPHHERDR